MSDFKFKIIDNIEDEDLMSIFNDDSVIYVKPTVYAMSDRKLESLVNIARIQKYYQPYYDSVDYQMWKDSDLNDSDKFKSENYFLQADVETTEELYWAIENKTKPIFSKINSNAYITYEKAKQVLNNIISEEMTEYEKVLSIYDYICVNTVYDYSATSVESEDVDPSGVTAFYLDGVFLTNDIYKLAVCDGFSKTFSLLCNMIGIDAIRIVGDAYTGRTSGGHAWNKVFVEVDPESDGRECFLVDITWSEITLSSSLEQSSHMYFLLSDNYVKDTHSQFKYRPEFQVYQSPIDYSYYESTQFKYKDKEFDLVIDCDEDIESLFYYNLDNLKPTLEVIVDYDYMVSVYQKETGKVYEPSKDYSFNAVKGSYVYYVNLEKTLLEKMRQLKFNEQAFDIYTSGELFKYADGKNGLVYVMEQFFNLDEDGESSHLINYLSENNIYGDFVLMIDLNVLGLTDKDVRKLSGVYLAYYASNLIKEDIDKSNINIILDFIQHDGSAISSITTLYFDMQISEKVVNS